MVILGRSPVFIGIALEHFLTQASQDINLIDLLYSETPNVPNIRVDAIDDRRNVLTPNRLHFFETYMDRQDFSKITSPEQRVQYQYLIETKLEAAQGLKEVFLDFLGN